MLVLFSDSTSRKVSIFCTHPCDWKCTVGIAMCIQTEEPPLPPPEKSIHYLKMLLFKAVCLFVFKQETHDKAFWETGERDPWKEKRKSPSSLKS